MSKKTTKLPSTFAEYIATLDGKSVEFVVQGEEGLHSGKISVPGDYLMFGETAYAIACIASIKPH